MLKRALRYICGSWLPERMGQLASNAVDKVIEYHAGTLRLLYDQVHYHILYSVSQEFERLIHHVVVY